jgi:hypothetical protein
MVGFAVGREMIEGLRGRLGLRAAAGRSGGSWREAEEDWADGRDRESFFIFFLDDLS